MNVSAGLWATPPPAERTLFSRLVYMSHMAHCAPPPPGTVANSRPKYVKVNPSRAVPRCASPRLAPRRWTCLKLATIMAEAARPPCTPWKLLQTTANLSVCYFLFPSPAPFAMSLPVVLPGSCCPVAGASQLAEPPYRHRPRGLSASSRLVGGGPRLLLPGRPLLSLGLLQLLLGASMVALSFGALSLSNSPPIRNSCPFWAGSSVSVAWRLTLVEWRAPLLRRLLASKPSAGAFNISDIDGAQFCTYSSCVYQC